VGPRGGDAFVLGVAAALEEAFAGDPEFARPKPDIAAVRDPRTGNFVLTSALDNLVKGAAGQAIQNMNLMLGFPETTALEQVALFP